LACQVNMSIPAGVSSSLLTGRENMIPHVGHGTMQPAFADLLHCR